MKIDPTNFNIPELYNSDYLLNLLMNEPIEDIEELFVKSSAQFKKDLKTWFPNKPKTGSFKSYFNSLVVKQDPSYLLDKDVQDWGFKDFKLINTLGIPGLKFKKLINNNSIASKNYTDYTNSLLEYKQ